MASRWNPSSGFRNDYIIPTEYTQSQLWEASITPHDGEEEGEAYIQTFTVQNTEPEIVSVQIAPQDAFESSVTYHTSRRLTNMDTYRIYCHGT